MWYSTERESGLQKLQPPKFPEPTPNAAQIDLSRTLPRCQHSAPVLVRQKNKKLYLSVPAQLEISSGRFKHKTNKPSSDSKLYDAAKTTNYEESGWHQTESQSTSLCVGSTKASRDEQHYFNHKYGAEPIVRPPRAVSPTRETIYGLKFCS